MDPTAVSNQTVSLLGAYLNRRAYGGPPESAMDSLYQQVAARLGASYAGQQALQGFAAAPHDASAQASVAAALAQEVARDWNFGSALAQAVGQPQPGTGTATAPAAPAGWQASQPGTMAAPAGWQATQPGTGPFAPGWPAGQPAPAATPASKLTPGWIAAIVAGAALLLIAVVSTVVVLANQGGAYDEVAGTWVPDPASVAGEDGGFILRITEDGEWTLEGFSLLGAYSCAGELARDQPSSYTMQATEGICTSGTLRLDGDELVLTGDGEEVRLVRE